MSVPNTIKPSVVFPDGTQIFISQITGIQVASNVVGISFGTAFNAYTFTATDVATAMQMAVQINDLINGKTIGKILLSNNAAMTFSSVDPSTPSAATMGGLGYTIVGTGFVGSGINAIKADDGTGDVFVADAYPGGVFIISDTQMNFDFNSGPNPGIAGTYTVYYSTDAGATWTTTGLTIVAS